MSNFIKAPNKGSIAGRVVSVEEPEAPMPEIVFTSRRLTEQEAVHISPERRAKYTAKDVAPDTDPCTLFTYMTNPTRGEKDHTDFRFSRPADTTRLDRVHAIARALEFTAATLERLNITYWIEGGELQGIFVDYERNILYRHIARRGAWGKHTALGRRRRCRNRPV